MERRKGKSIYLAAYFGSSDYNIRSDAVSSSGRTNKPNSTK